VQVVEAAVQLLVGGGDPHPDVRAAVYKLAVLSGQEEAYETVLRLYKQASLDVYI
jgi:hypothetical protein